MEADLLRSLSIGLSRLLRYSFPGLAAVIVVAFTKPDVYASLSKAFVVDTNWIPLALAAVVAGTGLYAVHRHFIIPIHGFLAGALLNLGEWLCRTKNKDDSLNPTRLLAAMGIPFCRRNLVYRHLRHEFYDDDKRQGIDVLHAEGGLIVMIAESLAIGGLLCSADGKEYLFYSAGAIFILSMISGIQEHRVECGEFKKDVSKVEGIIEPFSIPRKKQATQQGTPQAQVVKTP